MLLSFVLILLAIAIGDTLTTALQVPIPGSVPGLLAAAAYFAWRGGPTHAMSGMFDAMIPYAPLLFVPAGTAILANIDRIAANWIAITSAVILGAVGGLIATGMAAQFLLERLSPQESER